MAAERVYEKQAQRLEAYAARLRDLKPDGKLINRWNLPHNIGMVGWALDDIEMAKKRNEQPKLKL